MKLPYREVVYRDSAAGGGQLCLGADIGGTNSNFGIFTVLNQTPQLLLSIHFKSQQIEDFTAVVQDLLQYLKEKYALSIKKACFGAAGVVSTLRDKAKPTNLNFVIDAQDILEKTDLQCAVVINDFAIIGYGLPLVAPTDLILINKGKEYAQGNKAIIGAGTGLGKSMLLWNTHAGHYDPLSSEGGHADCAVQSALEFDLVEYIKKTDPKVSSVSWEDLLSGNGIQRMYTFFRDRNGYEKGNNIPHPDEIFNARTNDDNSFSTFSLYALLYARCAKNLALDGLALGGLYIAGGIAARNIQMFQLPFFMEEFVRCDKQKDLLAEIPLWVIGDYNVSLYGAVQYLIFEGLCR